VDDRRAEQTHDLGPSSIRRVVRPPRSSGDDTVEVGGNDGRAHGVEQFGLLTVALLSLVTLK